jgi:hypothetical protein
MPDPRTTGIAPISCVCLQLPDPHHAGIPVPQPCPQIHEHQDPRHPSMPGVWTWSHSSPRYPPTMPSPLPFRPCWAPAMCGRTRLHPLGPARLQLHVEWLEPCPAGMGTSLVWDSCIHQTARNLAPWVQPTPPLQASQITTPPGSWSGSH